MKIFVFWPMAMGLSLLLTTRPVSGTELEAIVGVPESIQKEIKKSPQKIILLNLWATWCAPCKKEIPDLLKLQNKNKSKVRVLFFSVDEKKDSKKALAFLNSLKVQGPTFQRGSQSLNDIDRVVKDWSGAIPMTLAYNQKGELLQTWPGSFSYKEFEAKLSSLLK